jgi:hypothetical protein
MIINKRAALKKKFIIPEHNKTFDTKPVLDKPQDSIRTFPRSLSKSVIKSILQLKNTS